MVQSDSSPSRTLTALKERSDEDLMAGFQQGDEQCFTEIVRRYKDPLTNFSYRILGNDVECEDVVQDAFLRVYRSRHTYRPVAKLSTWIYTITLNLSRTVLRRRSLRWRFFVDKRTEDGEPVEQVDGAATPDQVADGTILHQRIQVALDRLSPKYRTVVVMRDIQDLPYEEIATITGLNLGTVKSRISRARSFLQEELKDLM